MRRLLMLLVIAMLPVAAAQINQPEPFAVDVPFSDLDAGELSIATGKTVADLRAAEGAFVFFDPTGLEVDGITKACWAIDTSPFRECSSGDVQVRIGDGSGAAVQLPAPSNSRYTADFALALFVDFAGSEDAQSLPIGKSLVLPSVEGVMSFESIRAIPSQAEHFDLSGPKDSLGRLVTLAEGDTVHITGNNPTTLTGSGELVTFEGAPTIAPFSASRPLLPFDGQSSVAFTEADADAAREGLDFERITGTFESLDSANEDPGGDRAADTDATSGLGQAADILSEVFNGALVSFPTNSEEPLDPEDLVIILYDNAQVAVSGNMLGWTGDAAFQLQEGRLANAGSQKLYGFTATVPMGDSDVPIPVKLPWWGWVLWGLAIAIVVANVVLRKDKKNETWDRFKWIGWVAGVAALVLVFFLWDLEVRQVWGTSALTTEASGTALYVTYAVQFVTLFIILGLLKAPIGMIIRGGLRLSGQGTFMGLGGPIATICAYLVGAVLLLPFLDLILSGVLTSLAES